jgi:hypothetical protein
MSHSVVTPECSSSAMPSRLPQHVKVDEASLRWQTWLEPHVQEQVVGEPEERHRRACGRRPDRESRDLPGVDLSDAR